MSCHIPAYNTDCFGIHVMADTANLQPAG